ncbi:MAG: HAMP domain-containing sensor histidine kinase [Asticcacaulis sp.]
MLHKAYSQDEASATAESTEELRLSVMIWHLCWSGCMLLALTGLLFLPASLLVMVALVTITLPGIACVILLGRDTTLLRIGLIWIWALCAFFAVALTGGITGPLAVWCALPLLAAVVLNQRVLIILGASLAVSLALMAILISVWQGIKLPDAQEDFWLSILAILSVVAGLGLAVLPALRSRIERTTHAEEARTRLLRILTEQPHLLICLNREGRIVSAYGESPAGLDIKTLLRSGLGASAHAPDRAALKAAMDKAYMEGRAQIGFTPHSALDHYVILSLRKGEDGRLYGVLHDASLAHAHEAALDAARIEAENLNQGKTQFLASMSHELRTPLNAVIGFSDIMRLQMFGEMPPRYAEYAQLIWESGQHVLDMINDVLDMSKIEAQKYEVNLENFDIREPVSAALRLIRGQAHDKGIDILSHIPQASLPVTADKRAIKQICLNLLSNAVKFTPQGGDVTLSLSQTDDQVHIVITDTGIGIAPDDLSRIGQPYEQSGTPEQKAMGTGLGLSIVKAMAHMLGGTMTLNSRLGEGTSVSVILPVIQSLEQPELPMPVPVQSESMSTVQSLQAFARAAQKPARQTPESTEAQAQDIDNAGDFIIRPTQS